MKINEIIRERRLERNLTQEQVGVYLGVSAPAVNKWEKGTSYPDITILPALARLLETDLNTLLSFQGDLSDKEISLFLNQLSERLDEGGFQKAYDTASEKLREYPSCFSLILNTALFLDGALRMAGNGVKNPAEYQAFIDSLYQRSLSSRDDAIRHQAQSMLISKFMNRKEYDKAEELLQALPDASPVDKKQLQANLFLARGKSEDAAKLKEEMLLSATNKVQMLLLSLMEIALEESRKEDAAYIADVSKNSAKLFDLWEYHFYTAHFGLFFAEKNASECIRLLGPMLRSLTRRWDIGESPLYRHIRTKDLDKGFASKMQKNIIQSIYTDEQGSFLKDCPELQKTLEEMNLTPEGGASPLSQ